MNSHYISRKRTIHHNGSNDSSQDPRRKITKYTPNQVSEAAVAEPHTFLDPLVNGDVASIIYSFLDCRELLNMACTSKLLIERLTYDHVIRSSMMHGGHAKTNVERLVSLAKDRRIHMPSPMRMLRVANGKRCEHCGCDKVNLVSADFGYVQIGWSCWECISLLPMVSSLTFLAL